MKYSEELLKNLICIYEKRDANSSNFRTKIKIKLNKEKYPKYFDNKNHYDDAIDELSQKGYISIKMVPYDTVVESISLNLDKIDEIKALLGIDGISSKRAKLLEVLSSYDDKLIVSIRCMINEKIEQNKSIKKYLSDDFIDSIRAVHYIENLDHDVFERNASNYIFKDSKRLSKLKNIINSIYDSSDAFLEKGILSVTPYLILKGEGIVTINEQSIDLTKVKSSIGLPIDKIDAISFYNIKKVTTIENLTTFYDYEDDGLIIYLGGFSNRSQISILDKLKERCKDFYHFGDIDFGGFSIVNDLMEKLNITIHCIKMDLPTLIDNEKYAQSYNDENYTNKLKSLLNKPLLKPYYDVINYMIDNNIWLEQESFYNV